MKVAKVIKMKQSYFDKLTQSTFVLKTETESKEWLQKQFDGIPVEINNDIEKDIEFEY